MTIYLGNIPYQTSEAAVYELLTEFGQVFDLNYPVDGVTGNYRGFAFVTIADPELAAAAIQKLNGREIGGRPLKATVAKPQNVPPSKGIPVGFRRMGENPFQGGGRRR
jgi:RNA recognition motif-containing protein